MVERAGEEAGLGFKAHPHMLRHACGFALAAKGTPAPFRRTSVTKTSSHGALYRVVPYPVQELLARLTCPLRVWNGIFAAGDRRAKEGARGDVSTRRPEIGDHDAREMAAKTAFLLPSCQLRVSEDWLVGAPGLELGTRSWASAFSPRLCGASTGAGQPRDPRSSTARTLRAPCGFTRAWLASGSPSPSAAKEISTRR
jgi:hypothetical protein